MCKLGTALFSGKIYTTDKNFTRPPVAAVPTNFKSAAPLKRTIARPGYQTADSWQKHLILDFGTQLTNTFVFVTYLSFDGAIYKFRRIIFYFG